MVQAAELESTVAPVVREALEGLNVQSVRVREETGHDGDRYLRVVIVFEKGKPEGTQVLTLRRTVRDRLAEIGEDRFPLTTFMTRKEADEIGAAD